MPDLIHNAQVLSTPRPTRGFLTPAPDHQIDPNLPKPQSKTPGGETEFPREVNSCRGDDDDMSGRRRLASLCRDAAAKYTVVKYVG